VAAKLAPVGGLGAAQVQRAAWVPGHLQHATTLHVRACESLSRLQPIPRQREREGVCVRSNRNLHVTPRPVLSSAAICLWGLIKPVSTFALHFNRTIDPLPRPYPPVSYVTGRGYACSGESSPARRRRSCPSAPTASAGPPSR
jgi:hypothetical protein